VTPRLFFLALPVPLLLLFAACQSNQVRPDAEDFRRLEQAYLNEVIAENEFDPDFAAHTLGDFYPVPFIVAADRGSDAFWLAYTSCNSQHGAKDTFIRLQRILQDHGLCMLMAATDARQFLSDAQINSILINPPAPPTKLFRYLYGTPGATDLFLSGSSTFVKALPNAAPPSAMSPQPPMRDIPHP
jgi:hypothetical protein